MKTTEWKDTEIGRIPKDWKVKPLGEIGFFSKGSGVSRDQSHSGNLPCIRYGEIYTSHNNYIREFYSFISPEIAKQAKRLKNGDILFAGSGETKEEIGKTVAFVGNEEAYAGGDIIVLSPNVNCSSIFLGFVLNAPSSVHQKAGMGQGDAIVHIHKESLEKVLIPFPPKEEQQRIAKALSDIDMLITSLDKAIEKKRLVKQGAMQQLLTGKKRLKGFTREWKKGCFGDFIPVERGTILKSSDYRFGSIPVIAGGITPAGFHDTANRTGYTITISASGANAGYVSFHKEDIFASDCSTISASPNYSIVFVYYLLCSMQNEIYRSQTGGAQPHIHPKDIAPLRVSIPMDIVEQQEIANVLSMIDGEISSLSHEREKYLRLKDGMIQELLTGKTRLI